MLPELLINWNANFSMFEELLSQKRVADNNPIINKALERMRHWLPIYFRKEKEYLCNLLKANQSCHLFCTTDSLGTGPMHPTNPFLPELNNSNSEVQDDIDAIQKRLKDLEQFELRSKKLFGEMNAQTPSPSAFHPVLCEIEKLILTANLNLENKNLDGAKNALQTFLKIYSIMKDRYKKVKEKIIEQIQSQKQMLAITAAISRDMSKIQPSFLTEDKLLDEDLKFCKSILKRLNEFSKEYNILREQYKGLLQAQTNATLSNITENASGPTIEQTPAPAAGNIIPITFTPAFTPDATTPDATTPDAATPKPAAVSVLSVGATVSKAAIINSKP